MSLFTFFLFEKAKMRKQFVEELRSQETMGERVKKTLSPTKIVSRKVCTYLPTIIFFTIQKCFSFVFVITRRKKFQLQNEKGKEKYNKA